MRLIWRFVLLLPLATTLVPAEIFFPLYYIAPSVGAALVLFVLACVVSLAQMLYQYWGIQKVEELAPARTHAIARWLNAQPLVQAIRRRTLLMLFLLAAMPGVRSFGVALWQTTGCRWGGWVLAAGTITQLALNFSVLLGLGHALRALFR